MSGYILTDIMKIYRPTGVHGGFHAQQPDLDLPELTHAGETWWPTHRRIGEHVHPVWEFYLQVDGISRWGVPGGPRRELLPGSFLAVPPRQVHQMSETPAATHHFYFAGVDLTVVQARQPELVDAWPSDGWVAIDEAGVLREPFRQLLREIRLEQALRTTGLRLALDYLVISVTRLLAHSQEQAYQILHPAVEEARQLMTSHPEWSWPLHELARMVGLSPNHLAMVFRRELGISPHRFLLQRRVERAQEILTDSDMTMAEAARRLGFSSGQHLAQVFRQHTGHSPTDWKRGR